jgi:hypothetical protein
LNFNFIFEKYWEWLFVGFNPTAMRIILIFISSKWRNFMTPRFILFIKCLSLFCVLISCNQDIIISTEPVLDLVSESSKAVNQPSPSPSNNSISNSQSNPGSSSSGAVGSAPGGATGTTTFGAAGSPPGNPLGY